MPTRTSTESPGVDVGQCDVHSVPRDRAVVTFRKERYPADWPAIREGIRLRANNMCEQCRAPNGEIIARGGGKDAGSYMLFDGQVFDAGTGDPMGYARGSEYDADRFVRVILTVAHVDHDETNNAPENLLCCCQRCHFSLDRHDNTERRKKSRETATGQQPLFGRKVCP